MTRVLAVTIAAALMVLSAVAAPSALRPQSGGGDRPRVLVSTDIGGTDPDDFQSMVHFLLYADVFDVEGIVSSPYGPGRREHILQVIDRYAEDYPNLKRYSARYPEPDTLRHVAKQGAIAAPGASGVGQRTEGSDWIVRCARRNVRQPHPGGRNERRPRVAVPFLASRREGVAVRDS